MEELSKFDKIKYIGYVRAFLPPVPDPKFEDYVNKAKAHLCIATKTLFKDPIWDKYTDLEILAEYYTHVFLKDEDARKGFEEQLGITSEITADEFADWAEAELAKEYEDEIEFTPETIGES